ncbi:hypothetical protein MMC25_000343 [Agyrium rufum]|nr:hypothetical protein [Agyrium rufum]
MNYTYPDYNTNPTSQPYTYPNTLPSTSYAQIPSPSTPGVPQQQQQQQLYQPKHNERPSLPRITTSNSTTTIEPMASTIRNPQAPLPSAQPKSRITDGGYRCYCNAKFATLPEWETHYGMQHASSEQQMRKIGCPVPNCGRRGEQGFDRAFERDEHLLRVHTPKALAAAGVGVGLGGGGVTLQGMQPGSMPGWVNGNLSDYQVKNGEDGRAVMGSNML